jgi:membrane protease YdiL (CAAX protease family)
VAFYAVFAVAYTLLELLTVRLSWTANARIRDLFLQWMLLVGIVIATWLMLRVVEKRPWSEVGLDRRAAAPTMLLKGAAFGGLTIAVASLALVAVRELQIIPSTPGSWWSAAGQSLLVLLPAGFFEELFIRGYVFAIIRRAWGWKLALIATSVIFGLLHMANPGADAESILAVTVAGFFLGAILLATRSLYAAGAAHVAWNWIMAGALHTPVSGIPAGARPDYQIVDAGPDWLTGGPWGPEGGVAAVAAMFVVLFYLYGRYLRRMEWQA